jgi:hypothetical protein
LATDDLDGDGPSPGEDRNRFDFSDTDFESGMNFIVGMRKQKKFFRTSSCASG